MASKKHLVDVDFGGVARARGLLDPALAQDAATLSYVHARGGWAWRPTALRRWRAALGDALYTRVPIICLGDSIVAGQGGSNSNVLSNIPDNTDGWVGQLRQHVAMRYGDSGEGFLFYNDSRITPANSPSNFQQYGPLRKSARLLNGTGQTLTIAVPATATSVGIIQANNSGDVSATYTLDGGSSSSVTTLTGTGLPVETAIAVTPGTTHTIVLSAPASAQTYIVGVTFRSGTAGVAVHRIGSAGYVSGDLLGGQTTGVLTQAGGNLTSAIRACYRWETTPGVLVVSFGVNDYVNQSGTGAAGGVTPALYGTWIEQFTDQAVTDGWCVLLLGEPRTPTAASPATEADYQAQLKAISDANDHVAYFDLGSVWGPQADPHASDMSLQFSGSVHPTRRGHGDIARIVDQLLFGTGLVNPTPAA